MPDFPVIFSQLRHAAGKSQRTVAQEMHISQALLSHYEHGVREPRLDFVVRACDYYGFSADYILGRTQEQNNPGLDGSSEEDGIQRLLRSGLAAQPAVHRYLDGIALLLCLSAGAPLQADAPPERLSTAAVHLWAAQALESAAGSLSALDEQTQAALAAAAARAALEISAILSAEEKNDL